MLAKDTQKRPDPPPPHTQKNTPPQPSQKKQKNPPPPPPPPPQKNPTNPTLTKNTRNDKLYNPLPERLKRRWRSLQIEVGRLGTLPPDPGETWIDNEYSLSKYETLYQTQQATSKSRSLLFYFIFYILYFFKLQNFQVELLRGKKEKRMRYALLFVSLEDIRWKYSSIKCDPLWQKGDKVAGKITR